MLKLFEFEWIRIIISNFFHEKKKKNQIELILDDEHKSELKFSKCK